MKQENLNLNHAVIVGCGPVGRALAGMFEHHARAAIEAHQIESSRSNFNSLRQSVWSRSNSETKNFSEDLSRLNSIQPVTHVLIAIPDSAIRDFVRTHQAALRGKICTHFSGSIGIVRDSENNEPLVYPTHPLCSFSRLKVETTEFNEAAQFREAFQSVHFCLSDEGPPLADLLPPFANHPFFRISDQNRETYHALLAAAVAMQVTAWEKVSTQLRSLVSTETQTLGPALIPLLESVTDNLRRSLSHSTTGTALTGPLQRRDRVTVAKHLSALEGIRPQSPLFQTYRALAQEFGLLDPSPETRIEQEIHV